MNVSFVTGELQFGSKSNRRGSPVEKSIVVVIRLPKICSAMFSWQIKMYCEVFVERTGTIGVVRNIFNI